MGENTWVLIPIQVQKQSFPDQEATVFELDLV